MPETPETRIQRAQRLKERLELEFKAARALGWHDVADAIMAARTLLCRRQSAEMELAER